jgi:ParB family transcriptional regulator, chromosome partitioning protein
MEMPATGPWPALASLRLLDTSTFTNGTNPMTAVITTFDHVTLPLTALRVSPLNARKYDAKDVEDLAASIEAIGLLQPLVARKASDGSHDGFDIFAGGRRLRALQSLANGNAATTEIPCVRLPDDMSDAAAIAASLEENTVRKAMDPIDQYKAIADMLTAGASEAEIATTLRLDALTVKRRLALGKLTPAIHKLYRAEQIDDSDLAALTLASKAVQKKFASLVAEGSAPQSHRLKAWIQGSNAEVTTAAALFPLDSYPGEIRNDLFGAADTGLFMDVDLFWKHQNTAIAARRDAYLACGWKQVVLFEPGKVYRQWEYTSLAKRRGGEVHIIVEPNGAVTFQEGCGTHAQANAAVCSGAAASSTNAAAIVSEPLATEPEAKRPELTVPLANYVDNVRLALVRAALLGKPKMAVRVLLTQLLAGATANLKAHPQIDQHITPQIAATLDTMEAPKAFASAQKEARALIGLKARDPQHGITITGAVGIHDKRFAKLFTLVLALSDKEVSQLLTVIAGELLGLGTGLVDQIGTALEIDTTKHWTADDAVFELMTSREISMFALEDVVGKETVDANISATGKQMRDLIRMAVLDGTAWCPPWLQFPAGQYDPARAERSHRAQPA